MGFLDRLFARFKRSRAGAAGAVASAAPPAKADKPPTAAPAVAPAKAVAGPTAKAPAKAAAKAPAKAPAKAATTPPAKPIRPSACGPLRLAVGDHVTHYRERFVVVGSRYLEAPGAKSWHYCVRDAAGGAAVLVAPEGADAVCSLQRTMKGDVRWEADEIAVPAGRMKIARTGKAKVQSWGDAGPASAAKTMEFREFEDKAGEHVAALEDYHGVREARCGETVFESELTFERAVDGASGGVFSKAAERAGAFEDAPDGDIVKGTPRAAARVLELNVGASAPKAGAPVDHDPTAYDDDAWADTDDVGPTAAAARRKSTPTPKPAAQPLPADDDEWSSAAELIGGAADAKTPDAAAG